MVTYDVESDVEGLTYCWREDDIHEFRFQRVDNPTVDAWSTMAHALNHARPLPTVLYSLYYLNGLWPTPYAVRAFMTFMRHRPPSVRCVSALMMGEGNAALILTQAVLRQLPLHGNTVQQLFFDEDEAVRWLHTCQRSAPKP